MKIDMELEDTVHFKHCVIDMKEDTVRPDLHKMLLAFQDNPRDFPQRIVELFKKYNLIYGDKLTDAGKQLVEDGTIQMPEYGTYEVAYVDSKLIGRCDEDGVLAIRRISVEANGYRKTNSKIDFQGHDVDRNNLIVHGTGRILSEQESLKQHPFEVRYTYDSENGDVLCYLNTSIDWVNGKFKSFVNLTRIPKIDSEMIKEEVLEGYDRKFGSVMVKNIDEFEECELMAMEFDTTDHLVLLESCQKKIKRFSAKNVPIMSSDDNVIARWMSLLRKEMWRKKFLSPSEAEDDQKDWLSKIAGKEIKKHILKDEKLFDNLNGSMAFWNVAAMRDLSPTQSDYRCSFYVSEGDDGELLRKKVFRKESLKIDAVYLFDRYVANYTPDVLRALVGQEPELIFVIPTRADGEIGSNGLNVKKLPDGCRYKEDARKWADTHDRFIIVKYDSGDVDAWSMSNSIDRFKLVDGKVICTARVKVSPEYDLDEYIEEFIGEDLR